MAGIDGHALWRLADVIKGVVPAAQQPDRATARLSFVDDEGVPWYRIDGSNIDTPCVGGQLSEVQPGEQVEVEIRGGMLYVIGNADSPSVGHAQVSETVKEALEPVHVRVTQAIEASAVSKAIASAAKAVADAIDQHFWTDTSGVHVTNATKEEWAASNAGPNLLLNSVGQLFRDGLNNLVAITTEQGARAISFFDGEGNAAANITAYFGTDGARIGYSGSSNISIKPIGMRIVNYLGSTVASILSTGYVSPTSTTRLLTVSQCTHDMTYDINTNTMHPVIVDNVLMTIAAEYKVLSSGTTKTATFSISEAGTEVTVDELTLWVMPYDESNLYRQFQIHVRLRSTVDIGQVKLTCSWKYARYMPNYSFGSGTATGGNALSEGGGNTASGNCSHAEGDMNTASHYASHVEGSENTASGSRSHAEGYKTTASGNWSHAGGMGTIAAYDAQTAIGKYNDNQSNNAFEIGNGEDPESRSNAFAVDWDGNVTSDGGLLKLDNAQGETRTYLQAVEESALNRTRLGTHRSVNGTDVYNNLNLIIDDSGNRSVAVSEVAPWLSMLGLSVSSTTATVGAAASSIGTNSVRRSGNIVTVTLANIQLASAISNGSYSGTIATIPSGYRPSASVYCSCYAAGANLGGSYARITSAGVVAIRNQSGSSIAASTTVLPALSITYIID